MRTSLPDDDSFMTTQTHLNASRPSSSSGSYVTAFCDSYSEAKLKAVEAEETATAIPAAISSLRKSILSSDRDRELIKTEQLSMRHGSFDTDSGKGGSPPPQHAGIEVPDSEAKSGQFFFFVIWILCFHDFGPLYEALHCNLLIETLCFHPFLP